MHVGLFAGPQHCGGSKPLISPLFQIEGETQVKALRTQSPNVFPGDAGWLPDTSDGPSREMWLVPLQCARSCPVLVLPALPPLLE